MKATLLLTLLISLVLSSVVRAAPVQWTGPGSNGHFYFLTPVATNWLAAENFAIAQGGHLASINSSAEQGFINATFLELASPNVPLWVGLTDANNGLGSKLYTQWTTGEPVTYTNWNLITATGVQEPNNENNNEDFVAINFHNSFGYPNPKGTWNDMPLNGFSGFASEHPNAQGPYYGIVEVVPEPATNAIIGLASLAGVFWMRARRARMPI